MFTVARSPWTRVHGRASRAAASGPRSSRSPSTASATSAGAQLVEHLPAPQRERRQVVSRRCAPTRAGTARRARAPGPAGTSPVGGSARNARCSAATRVSIQLHSGRRGAAPTSAPSSPRSRITTTVVSSSTHVVDDRVPRRARGSRSRAPERQRRYSQPTVPPVTASIRSVSGGEPLDHERASVREPDPFQAGPGLALVSCQRHALDGVQQDLSRRHPSTMPLRARVGTMARTGPCAFFS